LALCPVVALELCAAARNEAELLRLEDGLASLTPQAPITERVTAAARSAVRSVGASRRLPAADYLIAAAAAERSFGVLHYDRHFDLLCEVLGIESAWIAPRGSLD
jgi:predicted nucleic acid-binding protein